MNSWVYGFVGGLCVSIFVWVNNLVGGSLIVWVRGSVNDGVCVDG